MGVEVTGKTLGIIGCGNIGSIVAERAHGLRMRVAAFDPFLSPERAVDLAVEKVELDELFHRADFITLHTPRSEEHTSELQSLMRSSYAVFCLKQKTKIKQNSISNKLTTTQ